jgi:hypothetical protein
MPSNALAVARTIRLWKDATLSPQALSHQLASVARKKRDDLIAEGEASPAYETYVDGRRGAVEETVSPSGAILYVFSLLGQAATFAINFAIARSPVDSGDYKRAWFVVVDGKRWAGDLKDIPPGAVEVMVTNPLPYARKIDVGHMKMRMPPGIVEDMRQAVQRKFPSVRSERTMVNIPTGFGGGYILKGHHRTGFRLHARKALRSDTEAGAQMTYPALILTSKR